MNKGSVAFAVLVWSVVAPSSAFADLEVVLAAESDLPYSLSPSTYSNSPSKYTNSVSKYTNSPSKYSNSPSKYDNSPSKYANGRNGDRSGGRSVGKGERRKKAHSLWKDRARLYSATLRSS